MLEEKAWILCDLRTHVWIEVPTPMHAWLIDDCFIALQSWRAQFAEQAFAYYSLDDLEYDAVMTIYEIVRNLRSEHFKMSKHWDLLDLPCRQVDSIERLVGSLQEEIDLHLLAFEHKEPQWKESLAELQKHADHLRRQSDDAQHTLRPLILPTSVAPTATEPETRNVVAIAEVVEQDIDIDLVPSISLHDIADDQQETMSQSSDTLDTLPTVASVVLSRTSACQQQNSLLVPGIEPVDPPAVPPSLPNPMVQQF